MGHSSAAGVPPVGSCLNSGHLDSNLATQEMTCDSTLGCFHTSFSLGFILHIPYFFLKMAECADLTEVSDVPQWVQCCVFVVKHYQHGWSRYASSHGTAVYVLPGGEEEEGFWSVRCCNIKLHKCPFDSVVKYIMRVSRTLSPL